MQGHAGSLGLSSGLTSRPSLSDRYAVTTVTRGETVVGVNLPTFVERVANFSPATVCVPVVGVNLPTFVERRRLGTWSPRTATVVGVNLPTFVERPTRCSSTNARRPVVGVNLPTFVERRLPAWPPCRPARLSSGLTSRPSLSAEIAIARLFELSHCRRG